MDPLPPHDPRDKTPPATGFGPPHPPHRRLRHRMRGFARPFLAVIGYYAVGLATFSIMAASNAPHEGDLSHFARFAVDNTSVFALLAALAAGRWWR